MIKITDKWRKVTGLDVAAPTQFSLRPTIQMTAQIHALMKMFPGQNKTDLMNDLLRVGISKVIEEITGDQEYYKETGEVRDDYGDNEDAKRFVAYYKLEVEKLLQQVDELSKQKGGKSKKSD
jgi:hypothetical protein